MRLEPISLVIELNHSRVSERGRVEVCASHLAALGLNLDTCDLLTISVLGVVISDCSFVSEQ